MGNVDVNHNVPSALIMKDLLDVLAVFKKHNVRAFLAFGAVLGSQREKDFIKWDDDIDLDVVDTCDYQTRKSIGWMLFDLGFKPQDIGFNVCGRIEPGEIGYNGDEQSGIIVCERNFKFSIFFYKEVDCPEHGKEMVCIPKYRALKLICTPSYFYDKPGKVKLHGYEFITPTIDGSVSKYLEYVYGNWKEPVREGGHAKQYYYLHPNEPRI